MQHFDPLFSLKKVKKGFIQPQISALVDVRGSGMSVGAAQYGHGVQDGSGLATARCANAAWGRNGTGRRVEFRGARGGW